MQQNLKKNIDLVSCLYVPGNQSRKLSKSKLSNASVIVPDMEDSVPLAQKQNARIQIKEFLETYMQKSLVFPRVNGIQSGLFEQDLETILTDKTVNNVQGIHVPKVDTVDELNYIDYFITKLEKNLGVQKTLQLIPSTESPLALIKLENLLESKASQKRIVGMMLGGDDFCTNFGIERTQQDLGLQYIRQRFALTCHAFQVAALDTPYTNFKNSDGLRKELALLKQIGIKGKFAIHPDQVEIINQEFKESQEQIQRAKEICIQFEKAQEQGIAAINFNGEMVDTPVYKRAKILLENSKQ